MDNALFASPGHVDAPGIAADLAVLDEAAVDVRLDVDLHMLAAKWTRDQKLVGHLRAILLQSEQLRPFWKDVFAPKYFAIVQDLTHVIRVED
jgi:hypothetical protein